MVQNASPNQSWSSALPSKSEMATRRVSSFFMMAMLLTVAYPFTPFGWLAPVDGPQMLDRFVSPPALLGALYFQWKIADVIMPVKIDVAGFVCVYRQSMYWMGAFIEFAACAACGYLQEEMLRRVVSLALVGTLWVIGYAATPERLKKEAWEHVKHFWMWIAIHEAFNQAGRMNGRRRRY